MHLCDIPEDRIHSVEIPTGLPLIFDAKLGKIRLLQEVRTASDSAIAAGASPVVLLSGEALLKKYNFGEHPELLFALDQVDVPLEDVTQSENNM